MDRNYPIIRFICTLESLERRGGICLNIFHLLHKYFLCPLPHKCTLFAPVIHNDILHCRYQFILFSSCETLESWKSRQELFSLFFFFTKSIFFQLSSLHWVIYQLGRVHRKIIFQGIMDQKLYIFGNWRTMNMGI